MARALGGSMGCAPEDAKSALGIRRWRTRTEREDASVRKGSRIWQAEVEVTLESRAKGPSTS